jgi:cephalosporin-C deacetylase
MPVFDLPPDRLETYTSAVRAPSDFDEFWRTSLQQTTDSELDVTLVPIDCGLPAIETFDVTFSGFGRDAIRAWLHLPAGADGIPVVVQFQGYGGGRGLPHESILWPAAGIACLVVDTRGQGSGWSSGETADPAGSGPAHPGFMTRGILDPHDYYYRRVFIDAVRAVEVARALDRVDAQRVAAAGVSQGGGIAVAVAGLVPDAISLLLCDVPGLCDFPRAIAVAERDPYLEITNYLSVHRNHNDAVLNTLSYFDGVLFAARAFARALFSIALMDMTCPPSTGYAAYNAYAGPKELVVYPYNDHEGGGAFHQARQIALLRGEWSL